MQSNETVRHVWRGFTLVEVLVVIGITALLIAILLPVVAQVRESARATKCLANVQQWGYAYQMYVSSNRGKSITAAGVIVRREGITGELTHVPWWEQLTAYTGEGKASLFCPNAREIRSDPPDPGPHMTAIIRGAAAVAWSYRSSFAHAAGSYGINLAIFQLPASPHAPSAFNFWFERLPTHDAAKIPVVCDCIYPEIIWPMGTEGPSTNLNDPGPCNGVTECCIDRHQRSVNVAFVDGHAERVQLTELWHLKWSPDFRESDVYIP